eukprot:7209895-Alexandrium_andersonii.AAC.1
MSRFSGRPPQTLFGWRTKDPSAFRKQVSEMWFAAPPDFLSLKLQLIDIARHVAIRKSPMRKDSLRVAELKMLRD